ncbi:MAG: DUF433 domain-containing protein [Hyphomicrobiales bacterium]|nr:DUF433 domain-containing protein [Hyphomicrobiales bacterium]
MNVATKTANEPWRRRLRLPSYQIREAARYAGVSPQTIAAWHKAGARKHVRLTDRSQGAALSYMQLIEVAVVAAARAAGVPFRRIRAARDYVGKQFGSEFPFAEYRFKTDGKFLLMDYEQFEGESGSDKLLRPDQGGQLAWKIIMGRLQEFEYEEGGGIVIRWHLDGPKSPITIDPRISFGAPNIGGTPTWVIKGRWESGEPVSEIAEDFGLSPTNVKRVLRFEGLTGQGRKKRWLH